MNPRDAAAEIVSIAFLSREQAHREHLRTRSYAAHVALQEFYEAVVEKADTFAEVYQGTYGALGDVPYGQAAKGKIDEVLEGHLEGIEDARKAFGASPCDRPLDNLLDELSALYARTLSKIRRLA